MLLILDSNEYIFAFGAIRKSSCEKLIDELLENSERITIRVTKLIVGEVRNNLTPESFREFIIFINALTKIDDDFAVPFEYSKLPFKVLTAEKCLNLIKCS